jgi:hypothetical protein
MTLLTTSKNPAVLFSEIAMMSSVFKGVFFLVEGDDDSRFWKAKLAKDSTSIVICEGKKNLLGVSCTARNSGIYRLIGVYDSDFEHLFGVIHFPDILARTDENDLETTLLASQALRFFLSEYADESLLAVFESSNGISAMNHLESMSHEFGKLRFINHKLNHDVSFDRLSPYRFISTETWTLDLASLHAEYISLAGITEIQFQEAIAQMIPETNTWGLCHGHDSMRVLAIGLRKVIGKQQLSEKDIGRALRLAFSIAMLEKTQMYKTLVDLGNVFASQIFGHSNHSI